MKRKHLQNGKGINWDKDNSGTNKFTNKYTSENKSEKDNSDEEESDKGRFENDKSKNDKGNTWEMTLLKGKNLAKVNSDKKKEELLNL